MYISLREDFGGGIPSTTDSLGKFSNGEPLALEIYWLELLLAKGYAVLYPNFEDGSSFAVQHIESLTSDMKVETPLLEWGQLFEQIKDGLPDWQDLPVLDFDRKVVGWDALDRMSRRYMEQLSTCEDFPEAAWQVRDLFCYPDGEKYHVRAKHDTEESEGRRIGV